MSFEYPWVILVAVLVGAVLVAAYYGLQRQRNQVLVRAGLKPPGRNLRRHLPAALFLVALTLLLFGLARPQATVPVPRATGTVILAFDVSNSMAADDIAPSRLAAAQAAAATFVDAQPDTVDIGIVAFGNGAQTTQLPTNDHPATKAAINRLQIAGGTSLGQAILGSLTVITGKTVSTEGPNEDLGYWPSATIVLLSDGEETGGPDVVAAAELAATAGVHIETIGIGTVEGAVIEVDGYQVATSLNEDTLTEVAELTTGTYHRAENAQALGDIYKSIDLRITVEDELVELTGVTVGIAVFLLTVGGLLMTTWFGRIV